jgi:hypothetical protein
MPTKNARRSDEHARVIWLCVLSLASASLLVAPTLGASGATQDSSGTILLGNSLEYGSTSYSVDYSYPSILAVGTNLTISVTLHVTALTGLVEYIADYGLTAQLFLGGRIITGYALSAPNATFLYPGSIWGPNEITIPLTANNTGLANGSSENATVSIKLEDMVFYGSQALSVYTTEPPMQGAAGSLLVENEVVSSSHSSTGAGQADLLYGSLAAAGVVMLVAAAFWPRKGNP